jgi:hypothetical protein
MFELKKGERLAAVRWHAEFHHDDKEGGVWYFAAGPSVADLESALRAAVREHLAGLAEPPKYAFNWGDGVNDVAPRSGPGTGCGCSKSPGRS